VWSRHFEQGLILTPADRRLHIACASLLWIPAFLIILFGALHPWARISMAVWLVVCALRAHRGRRFDPRRAVWRPGRGWSIDLPSRSGIAARLHRSTRVLPFLVALEWVLPEGRRVHLLAVRGLVPTTTFRRLCVLLRFGRGDG
jgi:hypothetical protein